MVGPAGKMTEEKLAQEQTQKKPLIKKVLQAKKTYKELHVRREIVDVCMN